MTDQEAEALLPRVHEFLGAVRARDADHIQACLMFTPAHVLAVLLAELLNSEKRALGELQIAYEKLTKWTFGRSIEPAGITLDQAIEVAVESERKNHGR